MLSPIDSYGFNGWFIGGVQALASFGSNPVPELGTLLLLGVGLLGLGWFRKQKK